MNSDYFKPDQMAKLSTAAKSVCEWVINLEQKVRIEYGLEHQRSSLEEIKKFV